MKMLTSKFGAAESGLPGWENIFGTSGPDTITVPGTVNATVKTYSGNDTVAVDDGVYNINTGSGSDTVYIGAQPVTVTGWDENGNPTSWTNYNFDGSAGNGVVKLGSGNNLALVGTGGNAVVIGGSGADTVIGGLGPATGGDLFAFGGGGNDTLQAGGGFSFLDGGQGSNTFFAGGDTVIKAGAYDTIFTLPYNNPVGTIKIEGATSTTGFNFTDLDYTVNPDGSTTAGISASNITFGSDGMHIDVGSTHLLMKGMPFSDMGGLNNEIAGGHVVLSETYGVVGQG